MVLYNVDSNMTEIIVPNHLVYSLGVGIKPKVRVTIKGYSFRSLIQKRDKDFILTFPVKDRKNANVITGEQLRLEIELDYETRFVILPKEIENFFKENERAKDRFQKFTVSKQRGLLLQIQIAKNETRREMKIRKFINLLLEQIKEL